MTITCTNLAVPVMPLIGLFGILLIVGFSVIVCLRVAHTTPLGA
mgnify:CR=1 FL=1